MEMGILFNFPLITILIVIHCSTGLQHFALVGNNWIYLILSEVKLMVR